MRVYILSSCDACRKATKWLVENDFEFEAIDVRKKPFERAALDALMDRAGWEVVFNSNSTTWRKLPEDEKIGLDANRAAELIIKTPTLMKRPLFVTDDQIVGGFTAANRDLLMPGRNS